MKYINYAIRENRITPLEEANKDISLRAAIDSIILLKNDNETLPLKDKSIDLFGNGAKYTIKGGLGSGEVNELENISIYDALRAQGFKVNSDSWLTRYDNLYKKEIKEYRKEIRKTLMHLDFINLMGKRINFIPGDLIADNDIFSNTCIYVISRFSGEGKDILKEEYSITDIELENIKKCANKYEKLIIILNVGGFFDLSFTDDIANIGAIIYMGNLGKMGPVALGKILTTISPSGSLPFTYPNKYNDIPYADEFSYNSNSLDSNYKEGIYVGYRYYDTFNKNVRYPFGYGLSYSNFKIDNFNYEATNSIININFDITNIGSFRAKETVLFFLEAPKTIGEEKSLIAFYKSKELDSNKIDKGNIKFDLFDFSYTDNNKRLLKSGIYIIRYGRNSNETTPIYKFKLNKDIILYEIDDLCDGLKSELIKEINPSDIDVEEIKLRLSYKKKEYKLNDDFDILEGLTAKDKIKLCVGSGLLPKTNYVSISGVAGYTTPYVKEIPSLAMADGPAGIRISPKVRIKIDGKTKAIIPPMNIYNYLPGVFRFFKYAKDNGFNIGYQKATSFPTGISLASTFNLDLINTVGKAISKELTALGISYYLAPAINIIKNPIGGRSFEYYSEDPYLSGIVAASLINGIENNNGVHAVMKHYACNNLEYMRNTISANLSNDALRDIYLKPFMIAIKYSSISNIMSSYNKINHKYVSNDSRLLNDILRKEFGFNGMVMTDWLSTGKKFGSNVLAIKSGNDLIMPGSKKIYKELLKAYNSGLISDLELNRAASNVLKSISKTTMYKKYKKN